MKVASRYFAWLQQLKKHVSRTALAIAAVVVLGLIGVPRAQAQTFSVLHAFSGPDGFGPEAGMVMDSDGNLYGTTQGGGSYGWGVVFKLDPAGNETVLHQFTGGADGGWPLGGVILDADGNLYGTTFYGGAYGPGAVFKLDPAGNETVLYSFRGLADGSNPAAGVVRDAEGNLYGTTVEGGIHNAGVVFKVGAHGGETVLHTFTDGADGGGPYAPLTMDSDGNLYGTTEGGGPDFNGLHYGVVFKMDPSGNETVLYNFKGWPTDAANPSAGVVRDTAGNIYGTTYNGGLAACGDLNLGCGAMFRLSASGKETGLHSFTGPASVKGSKPKASLWIDAAGNLYGTTELGGAYGLGTVFKLDTSGHETVLHSFTGERGGKFPYGNVIEDGDGNLYGTTYIGGAEFGGIVFKIAP